MKDLSNSRILIAGYGREGQSTHRFLDRHCPHCEVTVAHDDNEMVALLQQGPAFDWVVKSPGIPLSRLRPYVDEEHITSQTDLFLQRYAPQTIGVTGTKGKSTTAALIAHILKQSSNQAIKQFSNGDLPLQNNFQLKQSSNQAIKQFSVLLAGNMGIPLFDIIPQIDADTLIVAELSCHQLQGIRRAPHIGVLLNLYQEHLDHYDSYLDYQMAKMQLMLRQQPGDLCFYCADSPDLAARVAELRPVLPAEVCAYSADDVSADDSARWPSNLVGAHNRSNIYVARQVARRLGVSDADCAAAVATFEALPHRLQRVGTYGGVTFYNDSISTIPEATVAALKALPRVDTLILGGFDRGIDYSPLVSFLAADTALRNIVFVGAAGHRISKLLNTKQKQQFNNSTTQQFNTFLCDDYPTLVDWCFRHTPAGGVCLLSPAAASYDAFKNFEHRGETFCQLVKTYLPHRSN
ncbi:MAG: UDP-N-acetylmuramoyl-L-alanine--D-glutamate ligase [Bacteroidales bacterium]|nr:UDP-N-acetylmuramoyl-L-alanine--D-glutamate ligase [Bacteroidales bacterium]